jgi:peptidyl-prolyl cis-trans isomerase SurA
LEEIKTRRTILFMKIITKTKLLFFCATLLALLVNIINVNALEDGVAAVVNDGIITQGELKNRVDLALMEFRVDNLSAEQLQSLKLRTLSNMIEEELQRQYAKSIGITVSQRDMNIALDIIEKNNHLEPGGYKDAVGDLIDTANKKIEAEILWQKIVNQTLRSKVIVSNVEVDRLIRDMVKAKQVVEWEVAQIFIAEDEDTDPAMAKKRINDIAEQLKNNTASFSQLAKAFSEDAAAKRGGQMGWFSAGEMLPELEKQLLVMQPGEISAPVKTNMGWHIIKLERQRTNKPIQTEPVFEVNSWLLQVNSTGDKKLDRENRKLLLKKVRNFENEDDVKAFMEEIAENKAFSGSHSLGEQPIANLPAEFELTPRNIRVGRSTKVIETDSGWEALFVVGTKTKLPEKLNEYRTRIRERLVENRLDLEARRFLRELKERTFVDVRI